MIVCCSGQVSRYVRGRHQRGRWRSTKTPPAPKSRGENLRRDDHRVVVLVPQVPTTPLPRPTHHSEELAPDPVRSPSTVEAARSSALSVATSYAADRHKTSAPSEPRTASLRRLPRRAGARLLRPQSPDHRPRRLHPAYGAGITGRDSVDDDAVLRSHPLAKGAPPQAIRAALLPQDQPEFDATYEAAVARTKISQDFAVLVPTLERWRGVAVLRSDPECSAASRGGPPRCSPARPARMTTPSR